jgi:hypothetical protein
MIKDHVVHFVSMRRRTLAVALMVPLVSLAIASPALAKEPTGDFTVFKQCPRFAPSIAELCLYAQIMSGEVTINKLTVPITRPTTFQGGIDVGTGKEEETFVAALGGETLANTPQPIPGGISALIDCNEAKGESLPAQAERGKCKALLRRPHVSTDAYETVELARPADEIGIGRLNDIFEEGNALTLPVKIHLENPALGNSCYIGSSAEPILFQMTSGTTKPPPPNKPIHGAAGELHILDEGLFVVVDGPRFLVNNTFSAPAATGCGGHFASVFDPLIDSKIGLPAPSGYNTVIHAGPGYLASAQAVLASEQ